MTTCKMYMGFCSAIALCGLLLVRQFAAVNESPDSGTARPSVDNPTIDEAWANVDAPYGLQRPATMTPVLLFRALVPGPATKS